VLPAEAETATRLTRSISLAVPILSAAMDTVTEARLAIAIAREGGLGVVHRNLSIADQVAEVDKVKRSESGMIVEPVTLPPDAPVREALAVMERYRVSGVPITEPDGRLVGILTNRDLRFVDDVEQPVSAVMTSENLITAPAGTTLDEASRILHRHRVEKLPVVDDQGFLTGLITVKDIQKKIQYPRATKDDKGRLRVGAAVGVGADALERAEALVGAGVDLLVVDTAHGHAASVLATVRAVKARFRVEVMAGNVATRRCDGGADRGRGGRGQGRRRPRLDLHHPRRRRRRRPPGDGDPRLRPCRREARHPGRRRRRDPVQRRCRQGDRGGRPRGDARQPPRRRRREPRRGRPLPGRAVQGVPRDGLDRGDEGALLLEGPLFPGGDRHHLEAGAGGDRGRVAYKGPLGPLVYQIVGGLRSAMGYVGAPDIETLRRSTQFVRITAAGLRESHPHDVTITREAPNYRVGG
jgi:IMP dehydrogenase